MKQRQEQAQVQMRRKEAQLQLLAEEEDDGGLDFKVKVSMRDYELLQRLKLQHAAQLPPPDQFN